MDAVKVTLEQRIWRIWSYCRENQDSLDSERHIKMITSVITDAVCGLQRKIDDQVARTHELQSDITAMRKRLKRYKATEFAAGFPGSDVY